MADKRISKKKLMLIVSSAVIALGILIAVLVVSFFGDKGYRTISIIEVSGNVGVVKDGIEYKAYVGMRLQEGYEIVTSGDSYVRLVLDDDKYVKLESGSKLKFETLGMMGSGKTKLSLERGALTTEVVNPLGEDDEYVVNTPNAVLAVRGTFFRVEVVNLGQEEVSVVVITYGGCVASQRIMPDGQIVDEEVLINAGYKTTISMTTNDTFYVVEEVEGAQDVTGDGELDRQPIGIEGISDEDLVDIYFATRNGHKLFLTEKEVWEYLKARDVNIEEFKSVYQRAIEVKRAQDIAEKGKGNTTSSEILPNDSRPIYDEENNTSNEEDKPTIEPIEPTQEPVGPTKEPAVPTKEPVEATKEPEETTKAPVEATKAPAEPSKEPTDEPPSDEQQSSQESDHTHKYVETVKEATCTQAGKRTFTCECGDVYTEEIPALGHKEVSGVNMDCHSFCEVCGAIVIAEHALVETERVEATCTKAGKITYVCECGATYTEEIPVIDHSWGEWTMVKEPTCKDEGSKAQVCDVCGAQGEETTIKALGHTEEYGGTKDVHEKCATCGVALNIDHVYSPHETMPPKCDEEGIMNYTCICGYSYSQPIEKIPHTEKLEKANASLAAAGYYKSYCESCGEIFEEGTYPKLDVLYVEDGNITISSDGYEQNTEDGFIEYEGDYTITQRFPSQDASCTITVESGSHNITLAGINLSMGGIDIDEGATVTLSGTGNNILNDVRPIINDGTLIVEGGSFQMANAGEINGVIRTAFTSLPSEDEITFVKPDGSTFVYGLTADDVASDGNYYVLKPDKIVINELTFPDEMFRGYVSLRFDTSLDGYLSVAEEIEQAVTIDLSGGGITTLEGLNYLTGLENLSMRGLGIADIDLSKNVKLKNLNLGGGFIQSIDVSNLKALESVDLSDSGELTSFTAIGNESLKTVNVSGCVALTDINVVDCKNLETIDILSSPNIQNVTITGSDVLSVLNFSWLTSVKTITITSLPALASLDISGCVALTSVDLTGTDNLTTFNVTSAGNSSSTGYLHFTLTASDTYYTTQITGWNSLYMEIN